MKITKQSVTQAKAVDLVSNNIMMSIKKELELIKDCFVHGGDKEACEVFHRKNTVQV